MITVANNMSEACQYLEEKKARNKANHLARISIDGMCKNFNDQDYKHVKIKMKSSYGAKASAHSRTKLWNHYHLTTKELIEKY
jgi:hypothetical protein